ncbi:hypothetical protein [Nonomuraea sp. SYSU D8015]|uniref:hypothetical protein n=1 Tax=Nonomuraea sp. SYSU D8015 TaxID=2593644 RepID=UPI001660D596|nr:hypothetical protein [Nonomuraea sp. SYSU D8015]
MIDVIHLDMNSAAPRYIDRKPAVLEVRGGDGTLRGRVEIVGEGENRAYLVRPTGRAETPRFPIGSHDEAATYLHGLVRGASDSRHASSRRA